MCFWQRYFLVRVLEKGSDRFVLRKLFPYKKVFSKAHNSSFRIQDFLHDPQSRPIRLGEHYIESSWLGVQHMQLAIIARQSNI